MKVKGTNLDTTINEKVGLGFWGYLKHVLAHALSPSGRAMRVEYWSFYAYLFGASILILVLGDWIDRVLLSDEGGFGIRIVLIFYMINLIPLISVSIRRMHDVGLTGWLVIFGGFVAIIALFPSQTKTNLYGHHPKSSEGTYTNSVGRTFRLAIVQLGASMTLFR